MGPLPIGFGIGNFLGMDGEVSLCVRLINMRFEEAASARAQTIVPK